MVAKGAKSGKRMGRPSLSKSGEETVVVGVRLPKSVHRRFFAEIVKTEAGCKSPSDFLRKQVMQLLND